MVIHILIFNFFIYKTTRHICGKPIGGKEDIPKTLEPILIISLNVGYCGIESLPSEKSTTTFLNLTD